MAKSFAWSVRSQARQQQHTSPEPVLRSPVVRLAGASPHPFGCQFELTNWGLWRLLITWHWALQAAWPGAAE